MRQELRNFVAARTVDSPQERQKRLLEHAENIILQAFGAEITEQELSHAKRLLEVWLDAMNA